ncbi:general secretion pathway protein GspB [Vibrio sp. Isolate23]|uniref:general secretion pathway protein GspB n=1 Tax=Vibrio sp. Isolate23 TaxID=2908533 RepID=UPI001EFD8D45|nr:general secretion pathway protein GspB [Vibrio sp. Isolate23]MCG9684520.1 general secretion pathway protein GspB [Vibrio sp. Isolate23]
MSKVLQALERSEQNHQALNAMNHFEVAKRSSITRTAPGWLLVTVVVAPALLTGGAGIYQSYTEQREAWLVNNQAKTQVLEVPFAYQSLPYPSFTELRETHDFVGSVSEVELVSQAALEDVELPQVVESRIEPQTQPENNALLEGLDLSGLSPELAMRVESALESREPPASRTKSRASDLAVHSRDWQGKLPALNFQTHVYSSNPEKRWVKINGTEYREGDWIRNDIQLQHIEPQRSTISFNGSVIEVPALYDWKG